MRRERKFIDIVTRDVGLVSAAVVAVASLVLARLVTSLGSGATIRRILALHVIACLRERSRISRARRRRRVT